MGLIDKDYVIGAMEESKKIHGEYSVSINNFISSLKSVPTVDAEPVRHGHWIKPTVIDGRAFNIPHCSVCNEVPCGVDEHTKYCPNCGAKMDGCSDEE